MEKEIKITAPEGCEIEKVELVDGVAVVTFKERGMTIIEKKILDPACGGRMFYFDKHDPRVLFCDRRTFSGKLCDGRTFTVEPDEVIDFRKMPFKDKSFQLVIFDPPHLRRVGDNSWMKAKYGQLPPDGWDQYIREGFDECWRVLAPGGTLVFKWNEQQIKIGMIKDCFPVNPIMGTRTKTDTIFIVFFKEMKGGEK